MVPLLATGMGLAMFVLFALGALGPSLLGELGIPRSLLGALTALAFGAASVLSLCTGHITDLMGGRRTLVGLLATVAAAFALLALGGDLVRLLLALLLAGIAQAFVNPATNRLIADHLPPERQAAAVGVKQSGVQIGAFAAGLLLPTLAAALSWRAALALVVPVALSAALLALRLPADRPPAERRTGGFLPGKPNAAARRLIVYSFGVGTGLASLNTYLPLYAHQELGMGERASGALIAVLGVAGIAARVLWARLGGRFADISVPLSVLAGAAACFVALMPAAGVLTPLVWAGAVGLGGSAVAANAVSMVAVVRSPRFGPTGHASALVSAGFFGGFAFGPLAFGALVDGTGGYGAGWAMIGAAFLVSVLCGVRMRGAGRS
ncbi:MFS transporter [Streptomyces barkulensis]|uniref:MFS transporter n=1 Tax=Streptomyces barkulensis TaxID=1257026 RepID=UPI0013045C7E|nr:MFS transporter [Streptomyces barkulensis]